MLYKVIPSRLHFYSENRNKHHIASVLPKNQLSEAASFPAHNLLSRPTFQLTRFTVPLTFKANIPLSQEILKKVCSYH